MVRALVSFTMQLPAKAATAAAHIFIFATPRQFG
jgi:hypothetical protein